MIPACFHDMLIENGLMEKPKDDNPEQVYINNDLKCCGKDMDCLSDGFLSCFYCGKVSRQQQLNMTIVSVQQYTSAFTNHGADNCGFEIRRKRYYKSATHFRDHLQRYLGVSKAIKDDELMKQIAKAVDVRDRNAYNLVRNELKKRKMHSKYKCIFSIIYELGGVKPQMTSIQIENCKNSYTALEMFFGERRKQFGRKSMPSVYMLLDIVLRKNGHEPYYFIPQLKDTVLRKQVHDFYDSFNAIHVNPFRDLEIMDGGLEEGFMQIDDGMSVLCHSI